MKNYACSEEEFLQAVAQHTMTVLRDDGIYRHVRFKRPDEGAYWFDLITWPGSLCIDGDMGTHVFRRLDDMFQFFRVDKDWKREGETLAINPSYWGEKLQAISTYGKFKEFSTERFEQVVKDYFDTWVEENHPDDDAKMELWEQLEEDVLRSANDGAHAAFEAAVLFRYDSLGFSMEDFWDHHFEEFTFHFIWCCYAIALGVKTYDEAKSTLKEAA